ncbi:LysR family transcriptional regulator [Streptomyces sp. NBC_01317]|uniref:LysR family transcriptional regulator n=1 Tax=Streptomyces sp. NBC_01317 TaxID=2903822 RepID=UPI002E0E776F|nr:LysR family transcriptional regulator [Streptomyces sp. NBC_01317]
MNIEGLRYARAVSQTKSFSAAARAYGVTQPALSNGIARLEEEWGLKLFDRSPRGVRPTAHGARILPLVERALSALDSVSAEARRLADPAPETIRVGVSPLIGPDLVARAFDAARALGPPRAVVLREADREDLEAGLTAGDLDVVLIPAVRPMPRFQHRVVHREPVVVVDPSATIADTPLELEAAADASYILVPDTCGLTAFTTALFHDRGLPLRRYPGEASDYRVLEEWAGLGLGAALLPASKVSGTHASCRPLVRSGRPVEIRYEAVWSRDTPLSADLARLVSLLATEPAPPDLPPPPLSPPLGQ